MWVYVHTCPNGKRYVGQTIKNPIRRWEGGSGYKTQRLFHRAIEKYGWDTIEHHLYEVATKEEMDYLEKYLIAYFNTTNPEFGYNVTKGGEGVSDFKHSEESKAKMAAAKIGKASWNKGKETPNEVKEKQSIAKLGKPNISLQVAVIASNNNGEQLFVSVREAADKLGIAHQNISKCLKGDRKTAGGYKWRYAKD